MDTTPPFVVSTSPDSGAVGLVGVDVIRILFSEKMDRTSAATWLHFYPDQHVRKTKWHGATEAEVFLEATLPADTVVIMEIDAGMRDAHKVKSVTGRRFAIATTDSLPQGQVAGVLIMAEGTVSDGVIELYDLPPDTLEYFQQSMVRRTVTDDNGRYSFHWLPVPGGPWLLRAFSDQNGNLRPDEKEPQRLVPDTLVIDPERITASAGVTTLYPWNTPGRLIVEPFMLSQWPGAVVAWSMSVTDQDTGWSASPVVMGSTPMYTLEPDSGSIMEEVAAGTNRVVVFVDLDADSTFGAVPESLYAQPLQRTYADTNWVLEPWGLAENIIVRPGLDSPFSVPDIRDTLIYWEPPPVLPDSLALADSLAALVDSLIVPVDSTTVDTTDQEQ